MKEKESWYERFWNDPVWSQVIAYVLITLLGLAGVYLLGYWPIFYNYLISFFSFLNFKASIPIWLIILALIFSIIAMVSLLRRIKKPKYTYYTEDSFYDILWYWDWKPSINSTNSYYIKNLVSRCPKCKARIEYNEIHIFFAYCPNDACSWEWPEKSNGKDTFITNFVFKSDLIEKVENEIDRKVITGEWSSD